MKYFIPFVFGFCVFPFFLFGQAYLKKKRVVSGSFTCTIQYCGGVDPGQDYLMELSQPKPYVGKKMLIRKGLKNDFRKPIVDSLLTDEKGNFSLSLPPGSYCMIQPLQRDSTWHRMVLKNYSSIYVSDTACFKNWFQSGYYTFTVRDEAITGLKFHIDRTCFMPDAIKCAQYMGPYPP